MQPAREDLLVDLGAEFHREFTYIQADGTQPDMSQWAAIVVMKAFPESPTAIVTLRNGAGITLGANGLIDLDISATDSAALVFPASMDWGQFPNEGSSTVPSDINVSGRLGVWELRLRGPQSADVFIPMAGIVCFRTGPAFGTAFQDPIAPPPPYNN